MGSTAQTSSGPPAESSLPPAPAQNPPTMTPAVASTSSNPLYPEPTVYLPPVAGSSSSSFASPSKAPAQAPPTIRMPLAEDADLKPTTEEIKSAFASTIQRNRAMGISNDAPLMTQAMRERRGLGEKAKKGFDEIRIRFRFPDRTIVEYPLPPTTPLLHLYTLLRSALLPSHASRPLLLYTSPPKFEFSEERIRKGPPPNDKRNPDLRGKKIGDMGWGGGVIVNVKWEQPTTRPEDVSPIREELKANAKLLEAPKMGMTEQSEDERKKAAAPAGKTLGGSGTDTDQGREKKVPKWFKGFGAKK